MPPPPLFRFWPPHAHTAHRAGRRGGRGGRGGRANTWTSPTANRQLPSSNVQPQQLANPAVNADGPVPGQSGAHEQEGLNATMAPLPQQTALAKGDFARVFGGYKTQSYLDPAARGPGSHTVRTLSWNPAGQLIATGSADRTLRIWNPERPKPQYSTELRGHTGAIEKVLFNPVRDAELASCSADGTVRIWDVRSKTCVSRLDVGGEAFTLSFSADGKVMLVGRKDDTLIPVSVERPSTPAVIPTEPRAESATSSKPATPIYTALTPRPQNVQTNGTAFTWQHITPSSPIGLFLTTGEGHVKVMSYPSFELLYTMKAHMAACNAVALSPSSRYLAVASSDALISLWDTVEWISQRTCSPATGGAIRDVSFSFDGRYLCGASDEAGSPLTGLEIFHTESGDSVHTIPIARTGVPAVAWHPSRYWLAYTTSNDGAGSGGLKIVGVGN